MVSSRRTTGGTAFVLAGGGSLGAVQVGMLRALTAAGVVPDLVVGASAGAINASFYAGDPSAHGVSALERIWRGLERSDIFPVSLLQGGLGMLGLQRYLVDPGPLRRLLARSLPAADFARLALPCHVVATDVSNGDEVVLSSGSTVEAVLASAAIPGVFPPVSIGGRQLIDGGVANNTPLSTGVSLGASRIFVLPTGYACALAVPPKSALGMALHAVSLLISRQLHVDIERLGAQADLHVVPPLCPITAGPHDFRYAGEWIERAATSTQQWLEQGGLERRDVPLELTSHTHEAVG